LGESAAAIQGYPDIERIALPRDVPQTGVAAFAAISADVRVPSSDAVPDLQDLARILSFRRNYKTA